MVIIKIITKNKGFTLLELRPQILVCCARERHIFDPSSPLINIFGNQSNTYINKYYNTYDYLHVWFIGCVCNCFGVFTIRQFHFQYWDRTFPDIHIYRMYKNAQIMLVHLILVGKLSIHLLYCTHGVNKEFCCIVEAYFKLLTFLLCCQTKKIILIDFCIFKYQTIQ